MPRTKQDIIFSVHTLYKLRCRGKFQVFIYTFTHNVHMHICIYIHIYIQAHICGTGAWWVQCLLIVANQPWHDTSHHPDFTFIKNTSWYGDIGLAFWYVLSKTRINVASGTGTVWLPTLKQNLQGTYPRINQHVIFQPRRNVNKTHPGKGGHTFNLHLYKTECHRRLATRYWLNYSTIDITCMFNHRSCLMKCFIAKDVEGLD